ncbi:MAG: hypothetical protein ABJC66_05165 [Gammaproteobacteria bacterium]
MPAVLALCAVAAATLTTAASGSTEPLATPARVEVRSADLVAVGVVRGDRMTIRLSRVVDNAPVADAAVTVVLRGVAHATTAQNDGSYLLQSQDLTLPGAAAVEFQVAQAAMRQSLNGTLQVAAGAAQSEDKNTARQLWWWVLNFAVCIGFLWLFSRRRKAAQKKVSD